MPLYSILNLYSILAVVAANPKLPIPARRQALSENSNVAVSLREMVLRLAERDGYYLPVLRFPTKPSSKGPIRKGRTVSVKSLDGGLDG